MPKQGDSQSADKRQAGAVALRRLLKPVRSQLLVGRIFAALSGALAIAPYVALVQLGQLLLTARATGTAPDPERVDWLTRWLVGSFLSQLGLYFLALAITHFADVKLVRHMRNQIIGRIAHAPLSWFSETTSGRVRKAIQDDTRTLHQLVAHAPVETTVVIVVPLTLLAYSFYIDFRLGLLAVSMMLVYLLIQMWTMRGMGDKTASMDDYLGAVSATTVEFADGIEVVKAFGTVGEAHQRYRDATQSFHKFYSDWVSPVLKAAAFSEAMVSIPLLLLVNFAGGAAVIAAGYVTPVDVITTTLIALVLPSTIQVIGHTMWSYQLAGNAALRIVEFIDGPELTDAKERVTLADTTVAYTHVTFAFDDHTVLRDVDMQLPPGTVTALVGPSGSGKSTLATMLARFQDPAQGAITIGGVDIRKLPTEQLYSLVSFVLQHPQLPKISIRDNIALAVPDATDEQIRQAARNAQILDEIEALPDGLDTIVGDNVDLSGGQKQRIAIARALLADTPILILDEATAATDPDCEAEIQAALTRLIAGRTVLVIGHKPETILGSDQVILLREGRIVDTLHGDQVTADAIHQFMEVIS